jgi:hypothetical protein
VDSLAIHPRPSGGAYVGWQAEPHGLLGAAVATSFPDLIVVDNIRLAARCFRLGLRNTLLLRGVADAVHNASRLATAGVRRVDVRVRRNAAGYVDALRSAGIEAQASSSILDAGAGYFVTPPPPLPPEPVTDPHVQVVEEAAASAPPTAIPTLPVPLAPTASLTLVSHDRRQETATFQVGAATYVIEAPTDDRTVLDVTLRHGGQVHRDCFDLAVDAARSRFAGCAASRCGMPVSVIVGHLADLFIQVRGLAGDDAKPRPVQGPAADPVDTTTIQTAPDLLDQIAADCTAMGWVGEDAAKKLAYLVSISRKLPTPLWCQRLVPPGAGASGIDIIADLTPPEDVVRVSKLTAALLDRQEPEALRHALLVVDNGAAIADDAVLALGILKSRGALAVAQPRQSGRPAVTEIRGPIALLTSVSRSLNESLSSACVTLSLDDSPAQTERIIATQGHAYTECTGSTAAIRQTIRARHHALQRALACRPVVIACADRISFPAHSVQDRRDHACFLGIVAAHALLHQHQRLSDGDVIVADERDVTAAITLATAAGIGTDRSLSQAARELLQACWRLGFTDLTMRDVLDMHPSWTTYTARGAIAELLSAGLITVISGGGKGSGSRVVYSVTNKAPTTGATRITCIPVTDPQVAVNQSQASQTFASFSQTFSASSDSVKPEVLCG